VLAAFDVCLASVPDEQPRTRQWLSDVLKVADADPWRAQARDALAAGDWAALDRLVKAAAASRQPPAFLHLVLSQLPGDALTTTRTQLLLLIQQADPGEFWAHGRFLQALAYHILAWTMLTDADRDPWNQGVALHLAARAVQLAPNDGDFWNVLGMAHYRAGNWRDAAEALEKAIDLSRGGKADDWFLLAMTRWRLGDKEAARQWYDRAVEWTQKNKPNDEQLRRFRAEAAELLGVKEKGD
jgi:uncharacterized protein HemY